MLQQWGANRTCDTSASPLRTFDVRSGTLLRTAVARGPCAGLRGIGTSAGGDHLAERLQIWLMRGHAVEPIRLLTPSQLDRGLIGVLCQQNEGSVQQLLNGEAGSAGCDPRRGILGVPADHDSLQEDIRSVGTRTRSLAYLFHSRCRL